MALRIAINGMGVIGRELFKTLWGKEGGGKHACLIHAAG